MRSMRALFVGAAAAACCGGLQATERPFVLAGTAIQEDDDERVFELTSWAEKGRGLKALNAELQYSFVPDFSVELGWGRRLLRVEDEREAETELEAGLRKVLRDPARHGLGVAFTLEVEAQREREGWRYAATTAMLPLSWQWGPVWTHLSAGLQHERHEGVQPLAALALLGRVSRSADLFGEWAAVRQRSGLAQAGLRWWLRRDRVALEISALRRRDGGEHFDALMLGLSLFDLSF
jgi:hypothetical protein